MLVGSCEQNLHFHRTRANTYSMNSFTRHTFTNTQHVQHKRAFGIDWILARQNMRCTSVLEVWAPCLREALKHYTVMPELQIPLCCLCLFTRALQRSRGQVPCMEVRQRRLLWQSTSAVCCGATGATTHGPNEPVWNVGYQWSLTGWWEPVARDHFQCEQLSGTNVPQSPRGHQKKRGRERKRERNTIR